MISIKTWKRTAFVTYISAGMVFPLAGFALATTQANLNAVTAAQNLLTDQAQRDNLADLLQVPVTLDSRPYSAAVDWPDIAASVMPSVVMVATLPDALGDGSQNRVWRIPNVQTNHATVLLTQVRAWLHGWAERDQSRIWKTTGAGFVVADGHHVVTAAHVLDSAESVSVLLSNGESRPASIVMSDRRRDVALLSVEGGSMQSVTIAPGLPRQGQTVATIGAPQGLSWSLSTGLVSRYGKSSGPLVLNSMLQIAGPITGGNSGGLIFNSRGEAVGLLSFGLGSFNHAIPIDRVIDVAGLQALANNK